LFLSNIFNLITTTEYARTLERKRRCQFFTDDRYQQYVAGIGFERCEFIGGAASANVDKYKFRVDAPTEQDGSG
jgi:hypothetical protein